MRLRTTLIVLATMIVALCACGASDTNNATTTTAATSQPSQPTPTPQPHFKVGQLVKVGDTWDVTINSVKTSTGTEFDTPKPGNVFLLIDVSLKNISSQELTASSLLMFTLRDSTGQQYTETFTSFTTSPEGKTPAGSPVRGTLPYEVPTSVHAFQLAFQADPTVPGQAIWDLSV